MVDPCGGRRSGQPPRGSTGAAEAVRPPGCSAAVAVRAAAVRAARGRRCRRRATGRRGTTGASSAPTAGWARRRCGSVPRPADVRHARRPGPPRRRGAARRRAGGSAMCTTRAGLPCAARSGAGPGTPRGPGERRAVRHPAELQTCMRDTAMPAAPPGSGGTRDRGAPRTDRTNQTSSRSASDTRVESGAGRRPHVDLVVAPAFDLHRSQITFDALDRAHRRDDPRADRRDTGRRRRLGRPLPAV